MESAGSVEASQRGLNVAMVYLKCDRPEFGNVLYFQNLTSLNPYFQMTGTRPDEIVGGLWPELGMQLPVTGSDGKPTNKPLQAGQEVILSDAVIVMRQCAAEDETTSARNFL